ncbi:hypothetical protein GL309_07345, partial [Nocardia seriolae]|nr:hypothetical protein [Nocardia seriolae]
MGEAQARLRTLTVNTAQAYNCSAAVEFLQDVPAVHNQQAWMEAALPTFRRVAGADRVGLRPSQRCARTEIASAAGTDGHEGRVVADVAVGPVPQGHGIDG